MEHKEFTKKVWTASGIVALLVVVLLLVKATFGVLLLVLAGALIAIYFRGLADLIQKKTKWKGPITVVVSVLASLILVGLLFWLIGSKIQSQVQQLSDNLPKSVQNAKENLNNTPFGEKVINRLSAPETQKRLRAPGQTCCHSAIADTHDTRK